VVLSLYVRASGVRDEARAWKLVLRHYDGIEVDYTTLGYMGWNLAQRVVSAGKVAWYETETTAYPCKYCDKHFPATCKNIRDVEEIAKAQPKSPCVEALAKIENLKRELKE